MRIEDEVFARCFADKQKLKKYGFIDTERGFYYSFDLLNGEFEAEITVEKSGKVTGKVIDKTVGEEYAAVHVEAFCGGFVGRVRAEYGKALENIRDACFTRGSFISKQTERLARHIFETYGETSDNPFEEDGLFVFRYPKNKKWYALVMPIKKNKLIAGDDETVVEVVNLKVDVRERENLLNTSGIFPAYHMNKKLWISVLLNETVNDGLLFELVDTSRSLIIDKHR